VGRTPLSRHRFAAMSGEHLCPDIVLPPCRENASVPTSFYRHVGRTPLPRHRFAAMSGEHLCPDIVLPPCRENASAPTSFYHSCLLKHTLGIAPVFNLLTIVHSQRKLRHAARTERRI